MPETRDFEGLLSKANVVGVEYDEENDRVIAIVTRKLPEEDLDDADVVSLAVPDHETDVIDAGLDPSDDGFVPLVLPTAGDDDPFDASSESVDADADAQAIANRERYRPIPGGVSEIHAESTAATGGHFPVMVTNPSRGQWDDTVAGGDLVRVSNCHVYALSGRASFGDPILQPSPYDGGEPADRVGRLAGYLRLTDGVRADVAARTTAGPDSEKVSTLDVDPVSGVYHAPERASDATYADLEGETSSDYRNYSALRGTRLVKSGRTTGVTRGVVQASNASIRVNYGGEVVLLRNQIITEAISKGGDSGSPVFTESMDLVGLLFAGSSSLTAISPARNIEEMLGVAFLTDHPAEEEEPPEEDEQPDTGGDSGNGRGGSGGGSEGGSDDNNGDDHDHISEMTFEDYVEATLIDEFGEENVLRQHVLPSGRKPDLIAFGDWHSYAYELENDSSSSVNGSGQANYYARALDDEFPDAGGFVPVLCVPTGHVDEDEVQHLRETGVLVREIETPEDVNLKGV